jgi:hypothetical protein
MSSYTVNQAVTAGVVTVLQNREVIDRTIDATNEAMSEILPFVAGVMAFAPHFTPPTVNAIADQYIEYLNG